VCLCLSLFYGFDLSLRFVLNSLPFTAVISLSIFHLLRMFHMLHAAYIRLAPDQCWWTREKFTFDAYCNNLASQVTSLSFVNEETLVAIGGDDKNAFLVWDLATGQSIFTGAAGNTPVFLVRGISGWADSGGCQGKAPASAHTLNFVVSCLPFSASADCDLPQNAESLAM